MLPTADIQARKKNLEQLSLGFMKETGLIGEHDDPLLYLERLAYWKALRDALTGIEVARVTLAKALRRLATEKRKGLADSFEPAILVKRE
jgi:hypothetical protein